MMARKPVYFKVWSYVERIDPSAKPGEMYQKVGELVPLGTFDTCQEVEKFLKSLSSDGAGPRIDPLEAGEEEARRQSRPDDVT